MSQAKNFYGIDFGTTSSAVVGYLVDDSSELYPQRYGDEYERPIPSIVAIDKTTGEVFTGRDAWAKESELSKSCFCFSSIKLVLDQDKKYKIAGKIWDTVDIAAELFKALKSNAKTLDGYADLNCATVAIPIGFGAKKRACLRQAAERAGIKINNFVSEPTAAFCANYEELCGYTNIVVFDWGGGTLDVSVIQNKDGKIYELATGGMNIAGNAIDDKVARSLHGQIVHESGKKAISFDNMPPEAQDLIRVKVEEAKRTLSDESETEVNMNHYGIYGACTAKIDRFRFADIVDPIVNEAIEKLKDVIAESGIGISNVDCFLMVGGSSRLRPLREKLKNDEEFNGRLYFPEGPNDPYKSMWNVGEGAAFLAMNSGHYRSNQVIGVLLSDNTVFPLLKKDDDLKGWRMECSFAVTDATEEARFVFCGSKDIEISPESRCILPVKGFLDEKVKIRAVVTEDNIFRVCARTMKIPKDYSVFWEYTQLKSYYELPKMDGKYE